MVIENGGDVVVFVIVKFYDNAESRIDTLIDQVAP